VINRLQTQNFGKHKILNNTKGLPEAFCALQKNENFLTENTKDMYVVFRKQKRKLACDIFSPSKFNFLNKIFEAAPAFVTSLHIVLNRPFGVSDIHYKKNNDIKVLLERAKKSLEFYIDLKKYNT